MIARLQSKKLGRQQRRPIICSDDCFHEMAQVMNGKPDVVVVRRDLLDEMLACHNGIADAPSHRTLLPSLREQGYKYYTVDRLQLFKFVGIHGRLCDA